ncbi:MAG: 30S ribosomal protein S4 [Minisyncoccia bacterium]
MKLKAIEKKERSLGTKLFLKAERCNSQKCVTIRKPYRPGMHGQSYKQISEYGLQLREKQRIQVYYGLNNKQMVNLFKKRNLTPEKIIDILERRLDRVVFYLGFAASSRIARQLIVHGHIMVNNKKLTIPSYYVKVGDVIEIKKESRKLKLFADLNNHLKNYQAPNWLKLDKSELKGECIQDPDIESLHFPFNIDMVVQFYSR